VNIIECGWLLLRGPNALCDSIGGQQIFLFVVLAVLGLHGNVSVGRGLLLL
jgi:hypothetical protein